MCLQSEDAGRHAEPQDIAAPVFNYLWRMAASPRDQMLKSIKQALSQPTAIPFPDVETGPVFPPAQQDLEIIFAEAFTKVQGNFAFCLNEEELVRQLEILANRKEWHKWFCNQQGIKQLFGRHQWAYNWHNQLADCQVSITGCEALVARTGSFVLSSTASGGRTPSVYAPAHVCIAYTRQLVYDIKDALDAVQKKYGENIPSLISFASGPSRTADIEKTLVTGVHGPKEVYCFLVEG
jgi:L-lactate dehydrogenase complex protein LldG